MLRLTNQASPVDDSEVITQEPTNTAAPADEGAGSVSVFLDLDTVLLTTHAGRYGPELAIQAGIPEALERMAEVADRLVVVVDPPRADANRVMATAHRVDVLRAGLGDVAEQLVIATCPHGEAGQCDCAKPGSGLVSLALKEHKLPDHGGWYVTADQEGVVAGRNAGLHTVRIGPVADDHLSAVHRADYEARDLMDAANRILLEALSAP